MSESLQPPDKDQRMPPLLRFLGLHLALGSAIGVAFVSLIIFVNLAGLKQLIVETSNPFIPLLLLYSFNVITFSSVTMGIGIMTMPLGDAESRDDASARKDYPFPPRGLRKPRKPER